MRDALTSALSSRDGLLDYFARMLSVNVSANGTLSASPVVEFDKEQVLGEVGGCPS